MPRDPGRETENYIRDFDPALFQDWISWIMDEADIPGISLFLLKDGDVFWKTLLGYANLEQGLEVND
jgi:hypothetical protein